MKLAICLLIKDENEYLQEWLDYHRKVGISHFYIYDNNSRVPISEELQNEKDVTIKLWSHNPVNQCAAYNDCCKTHNTEVDKIAFIDTDEFICFDSKYKTIQEVWLDLERQFGRIDHLGAYWRMYGKTEPYFQTRQSIDDYKQYYENYHIKSIFDPKLVKQFTDPHHAIVTGNYINEKNEPIINAFGSKEGHYNDSHTSQTIWIKHIWSRSLLEFHCKIMRGTPDIIKKKTIEEFYQHNNQCLKSDI